VTLSLSLATFCRPESPFAFDFRAHPSQEGYDEQKPVVVVEVSLILGLAITWEMQGYANVANASQRHR